MATSYLPAVANDFDSNPYLLALKNGVFDFRDFTLKPHNPKNMITIGSRVAYDPNAECPLWEANMNMTFQYDSELIKFFQKKVGVSCTGLSDDQAINFCYGSGANGKSTAFNTLKELLEKFFVYLPIEILLARRKDNTDSYFISSLKGARFVVSSEIPKDRRLNENLIKDLTGGEPITARNPYEKPFEFFPSHKLWMFGQHKPIIRGTDYGIWRRMTLIPFEHTIPKEQREPMSVVMSRFKREMPGILNWCIRGYREYCEHGFDPPERVKAATENYRLESDMLGDFLEECCIMDTNNFCKSNELFTRYKRWIHENDEFQELKSSRKMVSALKERGFLTRTDSGKRTFFLGIGILQSDSDS